MRKLSSRDSVHFTGRSSSQAAERGVRLVGHVLLAAEGTTVGDELDHHPVLIDAEHAADVVPVVPHALPTGVHVEAAVVAGARRDGEAGLGLQEGVLDALGLEHLVERVRALGQRGVDVTAGVRAA